VIATDETLRAVLALVIGLLLGSVLPADLLARRRGIDIRSIGDGNPGTVNAVRALGWAPGLITAAYDVSAGVVAIQIAYLLRLSEGSAYLAGIMSIVGHRFPAFRGFRGGGQGMAASAGMLVYGVGVALSRGWLTATDVAGLIAIVLVTFALTHVGSTAALVMLPVLVVRLVFAHTDWQFFTFVTAVAAHIWIAQLAVTRRWLPLKAVRPARGQTRD
jgi:acyl phosphate:glycerol-3-phosphate acyltransferase